MQKYNKDDDSILGTYFKINPMMETHKMYKEIICHEGDRPIITRFRVGCHKFKVQLGRIAGENRGDRLRLP